jgi:uncharacterized membrane protein
MTVEFFLKCILFGVGGVVGLYIAVRLVSFAIFKSLFQAANSEPKQLKERKV